MLGPSTQKGRSRQSSQREKGLPLSSLRDQAIDEVVRDAAMESSPSSGMSCRQVIEALAFFRRYVPGRENAFLVATASGVGLRERRRITQVYVLTERDIRVGRLFPDNTAIGAAVATSSIQDGWSYSHATPE
jgi:hypothetical protein